MRIPVVLLALAALTTAHPISTRQKKFSILALGDSLTDNGNTFKLTNGVWPSPAFYTNGRYSNGPTWVEYLTSDLGISQVNRAFGGATSDSTKIAGEAPFGNVIPQMPGLVQQAQQFLTNRAGANPSTTLVSVWIGANDYFHAAEHGRADITPQVVVQDTIDGMQTLLSAGYKNFMVFNLPPGNPSLPVAAHNTELASKLTAFAAANRNANIVPIDMPTVFNGVMAKLAATGQLPANLDVSKGCVDLTVSPPTVCSNPNDFITWDGIHPTTAIHKQLSSAVKDIIFAKVADIGR
ncbi:hypothetical protein SpCBS45565_g05435 [Spizellomyces sp. 'palustris']|nr:hypothetical protein SpCBS45565_g05435 [Spizellomyces sp. 'palustris']